MRSFNVVLSFLFLSCLTSLGYTLNSSSKTATTDGSRNDVQNAINDAAVVDGWTVSIPNGAFSWSSPVIISGKGVTLKGSGPGAVSISGSASPKLSLDKDSNSSVVVSGITFSGSNRSIVADGPWASKPFIISNCVFNANGGSAIRVQTNGGLIYSCTFNGNYQYNDSALMHKNSNDTVSWSTADTIGTKDSNGDKNLYVEECTFNSMPLQCFDFDDASRIVIRYCRFTNAAITSHGQDTSPVGMRHFEIYNNVFDYTFAEYDSAAKDVGYFMYIRGGTGVIADNVIDNIISQQWGNKAEVLLTVYNITRKGPCQTSYPAARQVGQSHNGSSLITDPLYLWGNTGSGNYDSPGITQYSPDECGNGQKIEDYLKAGRDYITKTVKPGYTKYPYPHPLRIGSGGAAPAPTATPAATPLPTPTPTATATPTPTPTPPPNPTPSHSQDLTIFGNAVPNVRDEGNENPVELGVRFRSSIAGTVKGVRFYKSSANTGTHVANLWNSSGQLLASATFTNESSSGWQQVFFSVSVVINANQTYIASYRCLNGHYACDQQGLSTEKVNGVLRALARGGVYTYGSNSRFPTSVWNNSNYWVDVIFSP